MTTSDTTVLAEVQRQMVTATRTIERLRERLRQAEARTDEPIAVVGAAVRLPNGVDTLDKFWALLRDGVDATRTFPPERGDAEAYYHPDPEHPGSAYVIRGGFLDAVDGFDPAVFGISPREAVGMDPQQRMALELAWEALESAGYAPDELEGSKTGAFVGVSTTDYVRMRQEIGDIRDVDHYQLLGEPSFVAGRISYTFGFQGPSAVVDTTCSSSLVAVHQACTALRRRECDLALAGGVNLMLSPYGFVLMSKFRALAPDGRCKTFDASADGYGRGEGGGLVTLKRLSDAQADGDTILATLRGSAVNHDGPGSGITVPNPDAQQAVVRAALERAGIEPREVGYVEAHGTGTPLGDPIELRALHAVLGEGRGEDDPVLVGSVKTNVGHLESAAGIAGLLKLLLVLDREAVPPHLHLSRPNPEVPWDRLAVDVPTTLRPWPRGQRPRVVAVSSFGASGTNAHAVLTDVDPVEADTGPELAPRPELLLATARTPGALQVLARRYAEHLEGSEPPLADTCHTTRVGRARQPHGLAVVATDRAELVERLRTYAEGDDGDEVVAVPHRLRKAAWLFTGQGSQYYGMARELADDPAFREPFDHCRELFDPLLPRPLAEVVWTGEDEQAVDDTGYTQPALFAVSYALGQALMTWGLRPSALLGHSIGEITAACLAGVMDLPDAVRLVATRARLMSALPPGGGMVALSCDEATALDGVDGRYRTVRLAAVNGPSDVVFAGAVEELDEAVRPLTERGVRAVRLAVSHAFHSPLVEPMLEPFRRELEGMRFRRPRLPLASNVTGRLWTDAEGDAEYWLRHVAGTVRCYDGLLALHEHGVRTFVEVGPHPVLVGLGRRAVEDDDCAWVPLLRRGSDARAGVLAGLGALHLRGLRVDWAAVDAHRSLRRVPLPTYPWQRQRYWFTEASRPGGGVRAADREVEGVGYRVRGADPTFEATLGEDVDRAPSTEALAWLVEGAVRAAEAAHGGRWSALGSVQVDPALAAGTGDGWLVQWTVPVTSEDTTTARCHASPPEADAAGLPWQRLGEAELWRTEATPVAAGDPVEPPAGTGTPVEAPGGALLLRLAPADQAGSEAGAAGQDGDGPALAGAAPQPAAGDPAGAWGRILRACGTLAAAATAGASGSSGTLVGADAAVCPVPWTVETLRAEVSARGDGTVTLDVTLHDAGGICVGTVDGLRLADGRAPDGEPAWWPEDDVLFDLGWEAAGATPAPAAEGERVLLVGDGDGLAGPLVEALERRGASCVQVTPEPGIPDAATVASWLAHLERPTRVVLLDGVALPAGEDCEPEDLRDRLFPLEQTAVRVVQHLATLEQPPRLALVTRGAMAAAPDQRTHCPAANTLWGLGRVVVLEHPDLWGGALDLDPDHGDDVDDVAGALLLLDTEDQQALRSGRRLLARLHRVEPAKLPRPDRKPLHRSGTVLVTGGFGGIGRAVSRWLALRGTERLVLAARTPLPDESSWDDPGLDARTRERVETVRGLRRLGARVETVAFDVSDGEAVRAALAAVRDPASPLRGVVHAAGVSGPQFLADVDGEAYRRVWEPKTVGSWVLHEATLEEDLDLFLCFSSIASTWGSQHLASYSAANAFLDGLAFHRAARGLPALTVNWGPWGLPSELFDEEVMAFLSSVGLRPLAADQCLSLLGRLLAAGDPQYVVCAADWATYRPVMEARRERPVLAALAVDEDGAGAAGDDALTERLRACGDGDEATELRVGVLAEHLLRTVGEVLAVDAAQLDADADVFAMGFDSLMVMEVVKDCRRRLGVELRPRDFFERNSVGEWAVHLHGLAAAALGLAGEATAARAAADAAATDPLQRVEALAARVEVPADLASGGVVGGRWQDPEHVLLTGATGFVGAHLLDQLLGQTRTRVTCLVRCSDPEDGYARVERTVQRFLPGRALPAGRVDVVPGDLARPRLGLDDGTYDRLAAGIDGIYHSGAWVDFAHTYEQLEPANVTGTGEVLRLALARRGVPVHHVSTYGIWGLPEDGRTRIMEDDDILEAGRLITGYVQSKWAAEHLVRQASGRGVPVDVYRLGRVLGDARTGVALTTHFTCRVIKGCIQLGLAPDLDFDLEMTPADYVADALVHISRTKGAFGDTYHLVNPHHLPFHDLVRFMESRGWRLEVVDRQRWWEALCDALDQEPNELHPVMDTVHELVIGGEAAIDYDVTSAEKALAGSGINCPPLDDRLLSTYFDFFEASGYLPRELQAADRTPPR